MPGKEPDFGKRPRQKLDMKTLKRLLSYLKAYKGTLILVTVCILLSALAGAASSMFLQSLIDDYITPLLASAGAPDYSGLIKALAVMAVIYLVGALSTYLYNRQMVTAAQGTLKTIRDEMFEKMQKLPIRYFDSHTHGDIMSLYTNDTDALRQMIAQSMAQQKTLADLDGYIEEMINGQKVIKVFCHEGKPVRKWSAAINCGKKIPPRQTVTAAP